MTKFPGSNSLHDTWQLGTGKGTLKFIFMYSINVEFVKTVFLNFKYLKKIAANDVRVLQTSSVSNNQ